MSWKNVKDHYRIGHAVQVTSKGICIGSPYIHDLIVISRDGVVTKRYEDRRSNEDLWRYQQEFDADPALLKRLVQSPDAFTASITVYTYDGGDIIEKKCEVVGWPNVTHDGDMMYENTFSSDRAKIVETAKRNADAGIEMADDRIAELKKDLAEMESLANQYRDERAKLEMENP
jgi:hypothetical protein